MGDRHAGANMQGRINVRGGTVDARATTSIKERQEGRGYQLLNPPSEEKYYPDSPA